MIQRFKLMTIISLSLLINLSSLNADPFPPDIASAHYQPASWPSEPVDAVDCAESCGDWKPYTRFENQLADPRTRDPSNGGTSPQSYVNVASSCTDKALPSIYYYLHRGATSADDVIMFRWRVESAAHNYATGKNAGAYSSGNPWSSALWTVFFDLDGTGYRSLAAHLDGSIGSPSESIDRLAGIWGDSANHSLDYVNDSNVHLLAHNPTAFVDGTSNKILNFNDSLTQTDSWPNGADETSWDYGTSRAKIVSQNSCNEYFIDYQIPVAMLDASGVTGVDGKPGPTITRDTPIAMMFCTANSLNNPLQKDCAVGKEWAADPTVKAPFGDYLSFNQDEPYQQPIISSVTATAPASCPGSYELTAKVQDVLALESGVVISSVQTVDFYYWFDVNGDGEATSADTGSEWIKIANSATLDPDNINTWSASWDATTLSKGKFLIGAQALDDNTKVDDDMIPSGVDNRTFSYFFGDTNNDIYKDGSWITGQQSLFPNHSPVITPDSTENWYGNPSVTGVQVALIGTAINACGVAPTIALTASETNIDAGGTINYTVTVSNPANNSESITLSSITNVLPAGFSYQGSSTIGLTTDDPTVTSQTLTWTLAAAEILLAGDSISLTFSATGSSVSGIYNNNASADTSFGILDSDPVAVAIDSVRLSLTNTPDSYSVAADDSDEITFTLKYANDSTVEVTNASLTTTLPAGVNYVGCTGGTSCSLTGSDITWTVGTIAGGAIGSVNYTVTVASTWSSNSLTSSGTLTVTAPDSSTVAKVASATVAVTGIVVTGTPAMSLTKTADSIQVAPGGNIIYTLSYINDGSAAADSVVITDILAAGTSYVSCTGGCSESAGVVTWNIGTVAANASGSVTVTVTTANPFVDPNPATNTATIDWSGGTQGSTNVDVGITGSACNTYYFSNTTTDVGFAGIDKTAIVSPIPTAGSTGTIVSVTAPVSPNYIEALRFYQDPGTTSDTPFSGNIDTSIYIDRANGVALNIRATVYDYNPSDGSTTQLGQSITNFGGSTKGLLSFSVATTGTLTKDHRLLWVYEAGADHGSKTVVAEYQYGGTVTNGISGSTTVALSNAYFCTTPPANLLLSNTVNDTSISAGSTPTLTYTLDYSNTGAVDATTTALVGSLPTGLTSCEYSTDNATWASCSSSESHSFSIGTISAGASGSVYIKGVVPSGTVGGDTLTSSAQISSDQTSSLTATAQTDVTAVAPSATAELATSLSADKTSIVPGDTVTYTVTVTNIGGASASNVKVTDVLPIADYYNYDACSDSCTNTSGTIEWAVGTLAAGASQTYTYTMIAGTTSLTSGITVITDNATSSADTIADAVSNDIAVSLSGNPQLITTYSASPNTGLTASDEITYTLVINNTGSATATDVIANAPMVNNINYGGSITTSVGSAVFDAVNNKVIYTVGDLTSGSSATLTYKASISPKLDSGSSILTNVATTSASNAAQQSDSAPVTASASAILALQHYQSGTSAYPAATLTADVSNSTIIFVDRTDQLSLGQVIKIGSSIVTVTDISNKSITVNTAITATTGTNVIGSITLSINYQNMGDADALNSSLSEVLPAELTYYSASPAATTAPAVDSSGTITWSLGTLLPKQSGLLKVVVFPDGTTGAFVSTATISADNASSVNVPLTTTIGGIVVTKTTSTPVLSSGGIATYSITLTNTLSTDVTNVSVTDTLSDGFSYVPSSATIDGSANEPTIDGADIYSTQPTWTGLTVAANSSSVITFNTAINSDTGAAIYQNNVDVQGPSGTGITGFDALTTKAEDVSVLGTNSGVLKGYVFNRLGASGSSYVEGSDVPLSAVKVIIHKTGDDCPTTLSGTCYVTYTNTDGYFEQVASAGAWLVSVQSGSGQLLNTWSQIIGSNDAEVTIPDQGQVTDHNGYALVASNVNPVATPQTVTTAEDTPLGITLAGTDSDGTIVSYQVAGGVSNGVLTGTGANLTYIPNSNFSGSDSFTFTVTDNDSGVSTTAIIDITITEVNDLPVAYPQTVTTAEEMALGITLSGTDSDGTIASYQVVDDVRNGMLFGTGANLTYIPNSNFSGSDSFTFTVTDNDSGVSTTAIIDITITAVNDIPVATPQTLSTVEDTPLGITLAGTDSDGTIVSYQIVSGVSNGVLSGTGANLTYTPNSNYNGSDSFTFTVTDNDSGVSTTATIAITVTSVNDIPVATPQTVTTAEDTPLGITLSGTDSDGTIVSYQIVSGVSNGVLSGTGANLTYTPNSNYNGSDSFTFTVTDNDSGVSTTATIAITVTSVNDIPVATPQTVTTAEDTPLGITLSGTDSDGTIVSYQIVSGVSNGVLSGTGANLTYTPNSSFTGSDSFTFTVTDNDSGVSTAVTINITVTASVSNLIPVAIAQSLSTIEDTPLSITLSGTDSDGTIVSYQVVGGVSNGTLTGTGAYLTYTPNSNFSGSDSFSFTVTDNDNGVSTTVTVNITVTTVNDPPVANIDSASTDEDTPVVINVLNNDTDNDGDTLIVTSVSAPNGTVIINSDGTITYTPDADFTGTDTINYTISDSNGGTDTSTVTVTVNAANDAPVAEDDTATTEEDTSVIIEVLLNDFDVDEDPITVISASSSSGLVIINDDGTLTFIPAKGFTGEAVIDYTISDGNGLTDTAIVTVTVEGSDNQPPVAVSLEIEISSWDTLVLDVMANDYDPDGDTIELVSVTASIGDVKIINGQLSYTPVDGFIGTVILNYSIVDSHGNMATAKVTIIISADNGPIITLPADLCDDLTVDADALYTRVDLGEASAVDRFGNSLPVSLYGNKFLYPPGLNNAYWQATDSDGNTTTRAQKVCVNPLISIVKDQTVLEGQTTQFSVYLNGEAPVYPLIVPYEVTGHLDDHTLTSGEVTFDSGTEVSVQFDILVDSIDEPDETVIVSLSDTLNLGVKNSHNVLITSGNIAPETVLEVSQAQERRLIVTQSGGDVIVAAKVSDPNVNDIIIYQWQVSDTAIMNASNQDELFIFDPSQLAIGIYSVTLTVTDSGSPQLTDITTIFIEVVSELIELTSTDSDGDLIPDDLEGYEDLDADGIPDYMDRINECNVLQEEAVVYDGYLIEGQPGVCIRRGSYSIGGETGGAQITDDDIIFARISDLIEDTEAVNVGGIFDYIAYGFPQKGMTLAITMPQRKPIPLFAVYRKYRKADGWSFFIEDEQNSLWSTQGEPGYCPPPNTSELDNVWTLGLTEGHWCVQQLIEDGGPNDDDGETNGTIVDPGGVGVLVSANNLPVATDDYIEVTVNSEQTIDALINDTDADGDILTITSATTNIGSVEIIDNQLIYTPLDNYNGDITIAYGITDNNGGTDHAVVYITMLINEPPVIANETSTINQGESVSLNLLDNDTDPEGGVLTLISTDNSSVTFDADGQATFTPDTDFYGVVIVNYTVEDGAGNTTAGQWQITVIQVHQMEAKTSGGGGTIYFFGLVLLLMLYIRKQRYLNEK